MSSLLGHSRKMQQHWLSLVITEEDLFASHFDIERALTSFFMLRALRSTSLHLSIWLRVVMLLTADDATDSTSKELNYLEN